jgi:hypothetical protein
LKGPFVLACSPNFQFEFKLNFDAIAGAQAELQTPEQTSGSDVVLERRGGRAGEAISTSSFERLDRKRGPDALPVEIVCDLDRHLDMVWPLRRFDVAGGGNE